MTDKARNRIWLSLGAPLAVILLAWGAKRYDASKMDVGRFVADSIRRDAQQTILLRVDRRVQAICRAKLPAEQQGFCE